MNDSPVSTPSAGIGGLIRVAWSPDGGALLAGGEDTAVLLDARTHEERSRSKRTPRSTPRALDATWGAEMWVTTGSGVWVWDGRSRKRLHAFVGHKQEVLAVRFSPSGRRLATGGGDNFTPHDFAVRVWSLTEPSPPLVLRGHEAPVLALRFLDEDTLLSVDIDHHALRWDLGAGARVHRATLEVPSPSSVGHIVTNFQTAGISSRGDRVATMVEDRGAYVWNPETGRVLRAVEEELRGLALSPDGELLCTVSGPRFGGPLTLSLRSVETGGVRWSSAIVRRWCLPSFSPDGRSLARGDDDRILVYEV